MSTSGTFYMKNMSDYESKEAPEGALVSTVEPGSPAEKAGVRVGDKVIEIEGETPLDILDWYWASDEFAVNLTLESEGIERAVTLERAPEEEWGLTFENLVFDGIRRCANACAFCFMNQLPEGMRPSLTLKDDDYRLSFLQGNFITLTNLTNEDIERIIAMKISPLNVSFHAANDEARRVLIGRNAPVGKENFEKLAQAGIEMNVQIVLVPEVNDGAILDETLEWLKRFESVIPSVGIVPVAYTDMTTEIAGKPPRSYTEQLDAARVIQQVQRHQFKQKAEKDTTWVHLADEFYINGKAPFPQEEWYDGFPQYENGIGIVWGFVDDVREHFEAFNKLVERIPEESEALTLVIGELATESFIGALSALNAGGKIRLLPVKNVYFGGNVSVTGLLTGQDIVHALNYDAERAEKPTTYLIPMSIFNADGVTLDDWTAHDIEAKSQAPVRFHMTTIESLMQSIEASLKEV